MSKASSHLGSKVCKARDVQKRQSGQAEIWWTGSFKIEGLFMQMLCVSDAGQHQFSDMLPFLQCAKWPIPGPTQSYLSVSLVQVLAGPGCGNSSSDLNGFGFLRRCHFGSLKNDYSKSLYVDDIIVSGPSAQHKSFWDEMKTMLNIEDPTPVSRVPGREHLVHRSLAEASTEYGMSDFAESACEKYLKLAGGIALKHAPTPFLVDAALLEILKRTGK